MNESDLLAKGYAKLPNGGWHKPRNRGERSGQRDVVQDTKHVRKMNERDLHAAIFDECRRRGWIAFHGSMAARTHRTEGEPDFQILMDDGKYLLVECKTDDGKLSPAQQAMIAHAAKIKHTIHIVRSFKQFLDLVK